MQKWLLYALLAVALWAIWAVIPKATTPKLSAPVMQVVMIAGLLPVASLLLFSKTARAAGSSTKGIAYAFATGLCGSLGNVAILVALKRGVDASVIYPLTGLYPLVTLLLARILLKERLNRVQAGGIVLAVAAIVLFSVEAERVPTARPGAPFWVLYALIALTLYGIAGITQKIATDQISVELSTICFVIGFAAVAVLIVFTQTPLDFDLPPKDWGLAILYGALLGVAMIAQFSAYRQGSASVVTAVTGLYPAVTVMLAVPLFDEKLDGQKLMAILLAVGATTALSRERDTD